MPRPHPPEFRRRAIELAREHAKPVGAIAKDLRSRRVVCVTGWPKPTWAKAAAKASTLTS
jgi:transposase